MALVLLTGCGPAGAAPAEDDGPAQDRPTAPSGERTAQTAFDLLRDTDALRLSLTIRSPRGRSVISVHADRDGNCTGSFDLGPMQRGEIIRIAGEGVSYIRYTDAALAEMRAAAARRGPEAAARANENTARARGKYLKLPAISTALKDQCDVDKALSTVPRNGAGVRRDPVVVHAGERLVPLRGPEGNEGLVIYVAAQGKPYIRFLEGASQGSEISISFAQYGEPVNAAAPPADAVLDMEKGGEELLGA
ncbi:hypothetical protein ACF07V_06710 [Streptomyces sp. NPDC015661]|uniref:hypothetical protein n=1 Tax=Streptomyces sp. NPDC015661 TaxID=3364961 RepID=UPI0036FD77BF